MKRALLVLPLLLAALVWWERSLVARAAHEREARSRVGRLVPAEEKQGLSLSALRLERAGTGVLTYGRVRGRWRSLDTSLAPADLGAIERLVGGLLDAQGFVVSEEVSEAAAWGIGAPTSWRVSLCGPRVLEAPDGDVQLAFDLGASVPDEGGSFVRLRGAREVWAIDADPAALLEPPVAGLPPLLEPYVVPRDWEGWSQGLTRLAVRHAAGSRFALERRAVEVTPEELRAGRAPWEWVLVPDAGPGAAPPVTTGVTTGERPAAGLPAHAFSLFVQRLSYVDVLDPARRAELLEGTRRPDELLLGAEGGATLVLRLGAPLEDGRVPLWNEATGTLYAVEAELAALALPGVEAFLEGSDANPWDPWLRR